MEVRPYGGWGEHQRAGHGPGVPFARPRCQPAGAGVAKGPVPLEPAITRDQFSLATRAGRGQS